MVVSRGCFSAARRGLGNIAFAHASGALRPGGRVVLKEPVTTDGTRRVVRVEGEGPAVEVVWRPRESYAETFGKVLGLEYQGPTCAHLVPWFAGSTEAAVAATRGGLGGAALASLTPLLVRADPLLQRLEAGLRGTAVLSRLLAPVNVLQDYYVFR